MCILRNLSYQLENEIDPQEGADDVLNHEWEKEQQRQMEELKVSGCHVKNSHYNIKTTENTPTYVCDVMMI